MKSPWFEPLGYVPPAAFEAHYHQLQESAMAAWLRQITLRDSRGGSRRSDASFLWAAGRPALSGGVRGRSAAHAQLEKEEESR